MDENWKLDLGEWSRIENWLRPWWKRSKIDIPETVKLEQLNDQLFEVRKPTDKTATTSLEVVFFHGLQLECSSKPYLTTWLSGDKSDLWLNWLRDDNPHIRILIVAYDASSRRTETEGRMDMYITCENLLHNLTDKRAHVGQGGIPVILVGHCLGGLVLKEVCVKASFMIELAESGSEVEKLRSFLDSVKGVFFYATPHHGAILPDLSASSSSGFREGPLFKDMGPLNKYTARRNWDFRLLRRKRAWKAAGVGEAHGVSLENFRGVVVQVPEASSRDEIDGVGYYTVATDHFDITHPKNKTSGSFTRLSEFIDQIKQEGQLRLLIPRHMVGMQALMAEVVSQLEAKNCKRLGVVGMGGVGKTTFANHLYKYILTRFEYASFVDDVKGQMGSKKDRHNCQNLQRLIMENLIFSSGRKVEHRFDWERLKSKKVLIVLDDIEKNFHVQFTEDEAIDDFSKESLIIVTTRNRRLLELEDFQIHDMKLLSENDSKRLLCLKAFRTEEVRTGFEGHVKKLLEKCGNLPLGLEVVGSSLYKRDEAAWVAMCETIAEAQSIDGFRSDVDGLWSVLRSSYDSLPDQEREMFLDSATCFYGKNADTMRTAWNFLEWGSSVIGWQNLLDRCLVKNDKGFITMHELLRDLGKSIACSNQPGNLSMYTRASDPEIGNKLLLTEGSRIKVLYTIRGLDMRVLHGLRNLRALWFTEFGAFDNVQKLHTGDCVFPPQLTYVNMAHAGVVAMNEVGRIRGLRCLILSGAVAELSPSLGQLVRLQHLEVSEFQVIPKEIGNLCELENLIISHCSKLTVIPGEIGQLQKLRYFKIFSCNDLTVIPAGIVQLRKLKAFEIWYCNELRVIPAEIGQLRKLEKFWIVYCHRLTVIPAEIGQLSELRRFSILHCTSLESLPSSITQLRGLQDLTIEGCVHLRVPFSLFCDLPARRKVHCEVDGVYDVRVTKEGSQFEVSSTLSSTWIGEELLSVRDRGGIPTRVRVRDYGEDTDLYVGSLDSVAGSLNPCERWRRTQCLRIINVTGTIDEVSTVFRHNFNELQTLEIVHCPDAAELHSIGPHLTGLWSLYIKDLPLLGSLPDALVELRALEILKLEKLPFLAHFPESISDLPALRILKVKALPRLVRLPKLIGDLRALEILKLKDLPFLALLPECLRDLRTLKILKVQDLPRLVRLPASIGNLRALEVLKLKDLPFLALLPKSLGDLQALKILTLSGLPSLERLPECIGQLQALRDLEIEGYERLRKPSGVAYKWNLKSLETLTLGTIWFSQYSWQRCDGRRSADHLRLHTNRFGTAYVIDCSKLPKRRRLYRHKAFEGAGEILEAAASGHFPKLKCVALDLSPMLDADLFANICRRLMTLEGLKIQSFQLQELSESVGELLALEQLEISWCDELVRLPESVGQLRSLKLLKLVDCCALVELPESVGHLPALERLEICECEMLTKLKGSVGHVRPLERLLISSCPHLEEILHSIVDRGSVKRLTIDCCSEEIPASVGQLRTLEHLDVLSWEVESLPSLGQLCGLKCLTIERCDNLGELPQYIGQLGSLRHVAIKCCRRLTNLAYSLGQLQALEELEIDRNILASLAEHLDQYGSLKRLTVETTIYDNIGERVADMTAYPDQRGALPEALGRLGSLEELVLKNQWGTKWMDISWEGKWMEEHDRESIDWEAVQGYQETVITQMPMSIGQIQSLKYLELNDCEAISELPATIGELSRLEKIVVRRCRKLEAWRPSLQHLLHVQELELVHENRKHRFEGSFFTTIFQRQDLLAVAREGRSLREAALMLEEEGFVTRLQP